MKVKVKVELYQDKIRRLHGAIEPSMQQAVEAVKAQIVSDQVVPKEHGDLERSTFMRKKSRSKYQIVYDTPYARRLYWHPEYNFRTDKNPNAQGLWMQSYVDGERRDYFKKAFRARFKANTKGLVK